MDKGRFIPIAKTSAMLSHDDFKDITELVKRGYQNDMIATSGAIELYFLDLQEGKIIKVE